MEIFSRGTLDGMDELIVVAEPTMAGFLVAGQIWETAEKLGIPALHHQGELRSVLLNKVEPELAKRLPAGAPSYLATLMADHRLQVKWVLPRDQSVAEANERGYPVYTLSAGGGFMGSLEGLASHLMAICTGPEHRLVEI